MAESYFINFLQACFTRYRDHQGVDLIQIEQDLLPNRSTVDLIQIEIE